jgi:hypothetical protein
MTGLPDFNYPAFHGASAQLRRAGYEVLNPAEVEEQNPTPGTPQAWDWYMRRTIGMVTASDGIALLPGWTRSRGAALEVHIACALNLPVESVEFWQRGGNR